MDSLNYYLLLAAALFIYQSFWFVVALIKKRNDVADVAWGLGFVALAWLAFALNGHAWALWTNVLITIWGARLALHIYMRQRGQAEDFRYAQWRKEWRHVYLRSFLQVFMLQGVLLYVIAWPVLWINVNESTPSVGWIAIGIVLWLTGFLLESVSDFQLTQFKKNSANKGKLITTGLWRYSRHPNYFGDAVQWWGIFCLACATPMGWITVVSPLLMTYLLRYVSGVPMLERKYESHPDFAAYKRKTSVFFPWKAGR
jgi:steroid 5-alpha reductase family enzyme